MFEIKRRKTGEFKKDNAIKLSYQFNQYIFPLFGSKWNRRQDRQRWNEQQNKNYIPSKFYSQISSAAHRLIDLCWHCSFVPNEFCWFSFCRMCWFDGNYGPIWWRSSILLNLQMNAREWMKRKEATKHIRLYLAWLDSGWCVWYVHSRLQSLFM